MGEELADEAHVAIEEIFAERGESLPARPIAPISPPAEKRSRYTLPGVVGIMLALIAAGIARAVLHTSIGFIAFGIGLVVWEIIGRSRPKPSEPSAEQIRTQAEEEGLTEIMTCAAEGNTSRIKELLVYGHKVNAKSPAGTTALMYAARNNHVECIRLLLASGADSSAISKKGFTALSLAEKFGSPEAIAALKSTT